MQIGDDEKSGKNPYTRSEKKRKNSCCYSFILFRGQLDINNLCSIEYRRNSVHL